MDGCWTNRRFVLEVQIERHRNTNATKLKAQRRFIVFVLSICGETALANPQAERSATYYSPHSHHFTGTSKTSPRGTQLCSHLSCTIWIIEVLFWFEGLRLVKVVEMVIDAPCLRHERRSWEPIRIRLTDVHEDNWVPGDMIAFIWDISSSDVRDRSREHSQPAQIKAGKSLQLRSLVCARAGLLDMI